MKEPLLVLGVAATVAAVTLVVLRWTSCPRRAGYPLYGYAGLALLVVCELLLFGRVEPVATYFTPLAWTCYLLAVDAAVYALRGHSRLRPEASGSPRVLAPRGPREFAALAFWSVPLWLIFEAYNLHLRNWTYVGMPEPLWEQVLGTVWSFATILPALFETADLLAALGFFEGASARGWRFWLRLRPAMMVAGAAFLLVPLLVPGRWAAYLFALVWLGFIFLLEPINYRRGHESLLRDLEQNRGQRVYCLMLAGFFCGLLWEFWNYWAAARWVYIFPFARQAKIFEMPWPGYLGFPPFALEMFAMYSFVAGTFAKLRRRGL